MPDADVVIDRKAVEGAVMRALRGNGRMTIGDVMSAIPSPGFPPGAVEAALDSLVDGGAVRQKLGFYLEAPGGGR